MRKVDLERNYIRNDIEVTEKLCEEEMEEHYQIAVRRMLKLQRRKYILDAIGISIVFLMIIFMLVYIFVPGGYGW